MITCINYDNPTANTEQPDAHMESALCWANTSLGLKGCSMSSTLPAQTGLVLKIVENTVSAWLSSLNPQHSFMLQSHCCPLSQLRNFSASIPIQRLALGDSEMLPHPTISTIIYTSYLSFQVYLNCYNLHKSLLEAFNQPGPTCPQQSQVTKSQLHEG